MGTSQVLIVGAGPTGLFMALSLARRGVSVRIVDKKSGPTDTSRAIVVQARTLEFYAQLGLADEVIAKGIPAQSIQVLPPDGDPEAVDLKEVGDGLTPYPNILCFGQDAHERLLVTKLAESGVHVDWNTTLVDLKQVGDRVRVALERHDGAQEMLEVPFVCGCDGAHSKVREALGIGFEGGSYERLYFVADGRTTGADPRDIRLCFDPEVLAMSFPVRPGEVRLLGIVPERLLASGKDLTFEALRPSVERLLRVKVEAVNWFSTYHVHHRVAERFHEARCFLAGDAGHVHSPVGGQGMNTGLGDAFNLSWKLAEVLQGRAQSAILDTYNQERIAFARKLVSTTDAIFQHLIGMDLGSRLLRRAVPHVVPVVLNFEAVRHALFKTVSQVRIEYEHSPLSEGSAGHVKGGDRLPWLFGEGRDNFTPLRSNAWQLHVYGAVSEDLALEAAAIHLPVHAFSWGEDGASAGFKRDAAYLVRPDGYVGLAVTRQAPERLRAYASRLGLQFRLTTAQQRDSKQEASYAE